MLRGVLALSVSSRPALAGFAGMDQGAPRPRRVDVEERRGGVPVRRGPEDRRAPGLLGNRDRPRSRGAHPPRLPGLGRGGELRRPRSRAGGDGALQAHAHPRPADAAAESQGRRRRRRRRGRRRGEGRVVQPGAPGEARTRHRAPAPRDARPEGLQGVASRARRRRRAHARPRPRVSRDRGSALLPHPRAGRGRAPSRAPHAGRASRRAPRSRAPAAPGRRIAAVHRPESPEDAEAARARLGLEELLLLQLGFVRRREALAQEARATALGEPGELLDRYRRALPFTLTPEQEEAIAQIDADLRGRTAHAAASAGRRRVGEDGRRPLRAPARRRARQGRARSWLRPRPLPSSTSSPWSRSAPSSESASRCRRAP